MFIHYKSGHIVRHHPHLPGIKRFHAYLRAYGLGVMPLDRTETIKFPVCTKSLFPMPTMRDLGETYEEICDKRALELLERAETLDTPLYAFWSGGIDSTCVLVSLFKNATAAQREHIVVLMSEESIIEYAAFYRNHIRAKLRCEPAAIFPYLLGGNNLIVSGEHNDQLFGSDIIASVIERFGFDAVRGAYDRKLFTAFFAGKMDDDRETAVWYVDLFERLRQAAPVPLRTNYDLFWWLNFALKWQNVYMRMLSYVAKCNVCYLSEKYLQKYYAHFFNTEDFQLWSMNNLDRRMRDSWRSYKWPAKELIYEFTKDADYRDNKIKRGSLQFLVRREVPVRFIDEGFRFYETVPVEKFYQECNDFRL